MLVGVLVDAAGDGYGGLAEDVGNLGVAEARGVVLEGEMFLGFVEAEAPEAVGIGKFAEAAELVLRERILQFVGDFDERHGGIIPQRRGIPAASSGAVWTSAEGRAEWNQFVKGRGEDATLKGGAT
jgi:hypothetical protein